MLPVFGGRLSLMPCSSSTLSIFTECYGRREREVQARRSERTTSNFALRAVLKLVTTVVGVLILLKQAITKETHLLRDDDVQHIQTSVGPRDHSGEVAHEQFREFVGCVVQDQR